MTLSEEILENWGLERGVTGDFNGALGGWATPIRSLENDPCFAWTVSMLDGRVGVAIPYQGDNEVNESFTSVLLATMEYATDAGPGGLPYQGAMLTLTSRKEGEAFAALCEEFVRPGYHGRRRAELLDDPVSWWEEWKSLLGNRNVTPRVYDVLGELCALKWLYAQGRRPTWNGPQGATADIDCGDEVYEVKSSMTRNSKTVTVHGLYQLNDDARDRYLVYCCFEGSNAGLSINSLVDDLGALGAEVGEVNESLACLGYPEGKSARSWCFSLLSFDLFPVDDSFPRICPTSFIGNGLPEGVMSINYTVSLDSLASTSLLPL